MKSGWVTKKLGEVCEVVLGGTPRTSVSEYWGGSVPWLTPGDMGKIQGLYVDKTSRTLTQKGLENGSRLFPANSVVLSTRAPIGYVLINTVPMCTNQGCKTIVPGSAIMPNFLAYNLIGRAIELNELGTGTTFKELATGVLKNIDIPIPPLAEQKRIVAKIDAAFEKVDKLKTNAEKNLANAKELFQSALDEAMRSKPGWVEKRLGEVCDTITAKGHQIQQKEIVESGKYPVVSQSEQFIEGYTDFNEPVKSVPVVLFGDHTCCSKYIDFPFVVGADGTKLLKINQGDAKYLYYVVLKVGMSLVDGKYRRHFKDLKKAEICLPPVNEQQRLAKQLDVLSQKTKTLQQNYARQIADCAEMRQAILREAFEGRL